MTQTHKTKAIKIGSLVIGGGAKIAFQSMLSLPWTDREANVRQAQELETAGCDIIRMAVPEIGAVKTLAAVKENCSMPVVADIHFDYRLALESVAAGADKIRINPGNIGSPDRVKAVADACRLAGIPIRVGVNSGSVEKELLAQYGRTPRALSESALGQVRLLERFDFDNIVVSAKTASPADTVQTYRLLAASCTYPLHVGVTEAGTEQKGILRSAAAIGSLLLDGIGDTIRVSLTASPILEVETGKRLLEALGLVDAVTVISCPTCARTKGPVIEMAHRVEDFCADLKVPLRVAVMGCEVNGPGEAAGADVGMAFGAGCAVLFKAGQIVAKGEQEAIFQQLCKTITEVADAAETQRIIR